MKTLTTSGAPLFLTYFHTIVGAPDNVFTIPNLNGSKPFPALCFLLLCLLEMAVTYSK